MMPWWTIPVRLFGRREKRVGPTGDGRQIQVWMRTIGKQSVITQVDVLCSRCGEWVTPEVDQTVTQDALGSPRNQHRECALTTAGS